MKFQVLGPLGLNVDGEFVTPTAPKPRSVLAVLMQHRNRHVPTGWLIEELWGGSSPASALATLQTYIYQLRKFLNATVGEETAAGMLQTKPAGYRLRVSDDDLDEGAFAALVRQARTALRAAEPQRAVELARAALDQWNGPALADVQKGPLLEAYSAKLEEDRLAAIELRLDAELALGHHRALISELKALTVMYPLNEGLHAKLMRALYAADRRCEALETFQGLRATLVDELGLEPTETIQRIHQAILNGSLPTEVGRARPARVKAIPQPAQLPPDIADFIGRGSELADLKRRCDEGIQVTGLPLIGIIGREGVGKTATAVRAAWQMRTAFPDAQFYVSYRTGETQDAGDVLYGFLRAAGLRDEEVPRGLDDRSGLFRSWTADRRIMVVLDAVTSAEQVVPLLPAGGSCVVIFTGRAPVRGLPGVQYVHLDALDDDDSLTLLHGILGSMLANRTPWAQRLLSGCEGVPRRIRELGDEVLSGPGSVHAPPSAT